MTRGIVIAGNESALVHAIENEAARRAERYVLALIPNRFSGDNPPGMKLRPESSPSVGTAVQDSPEKGRITLDWNPGSPIAARTLVIASGNRLESISEAILVCAPPSIRCAAADLSLTDVEVLVNDHVKGWFFLVKELTALFKAQGSGILGLAYSESNGTGGKDETVDFLGSAALAAFRSLTRSLLDAAYNEPYLTLGFSGIDAGDEAGYAAFIFKQIDEGNRRSNGKLHKFGKLSFFR